LTIIGSNDNNMIEDKQVVINNNGGNIVDPFFKNKLEKQIKQMCTIFKDKTEIKDSLKMIYTQFYFDELEKLYDLVKEENSNILKVSDGLLLQGLKFRNSKLSKKIFEKNNTKVFKNAIDQVEKDINMIINKDSNYNSAIMGSILYNPKGFDNTMIGAIPIFWNDIKNEVLKKMYFHEFTVITIFNPLYIIEEIKKLGYLVISKYCENENIKITRKKRLENFDFFIPYVTNHLQSEKSIVEIIKEIDKISNGEKITKKYTIKLQQILGNTIWRNNWESLD
jgi:hypothetical protein